MVALTVIPRPRREVRGLCGPCSAGEGKELSVSKSEAGPAMSELHVAGTGPQLLGGGSHPWHGGPEEAHASCW